jgi:NCAIR mutase (PurE)-related protein
MKEILQKLEDGKISVQEAEKQLKIMQIQEINDFAKLDTGREARTGIPEAIFAEGKEDEDLIKIILKGTYKGRLMITRLEKDRYDLINPQIDILKENGFKIEYNKRARILLVKNQEIPKEGKIGVITAGTSDIPVAEEARITAEEVGCEVLTAYDVGVAGIHRLFSHIKDMIDEDVKALIAVAGMEGALPSVVAGLVDVPVIGVPTSVGYGVGEGGFTALFAMLQSCAPGISVVNIDNGFGAGVVAAKIAKQTFKEC